MECPRCHQYDVSDVNGSHFVCNNPACVDSDGKRTQFKVEVDDKIHFPYNQIFHDHSLTEFYRKPYLQL